ncbi:glucan biosynthesis protein G [Aquisalimonas lutea]|uniref:glucan biosynthesis protein n=1 Tax=Aquisalimonas lutea TaxID=1327750 RepID=UPI0025B3CD19|nr:glucan biosynthesis protein G [Aquisalimonas lutea]MDN3516300.1 glucan biosynthesis protein G [Aquisalimonas lutea]
MLRTLTCSILLTLLFAASAESRGATDSSLFEQVTRKARELAQSRYQAPDGPQIPESLQNLDYQDYRDIRFNKSEALWRERSLFNIELFHLGFLYTQPVTLHQVVDGRVHTLRYSPALFDYGDNEGVAGSLGPDLGFAGFRVHYPLNTPDYDDEFLVFLGASYFRMVGRGERYGLSARGLAIDTALPKGEEFPRFEEFWLVRPEPEATSMTVYALLNSRSVTGAYRFDIHPGQRSAMDVHARLFARSDVERLGIAPLTSMFMWGENSVSHRDDHRPEVHDSDGLLLHTGADEWIWRPLVNPVDLQVSSLMVDNPKGFGLAQRDRDFDHYLDMSARYESRPGLWVRPEGDWGKGAVQLVEIPSDDESNDNIVAYWVPEEPFSAGDSTEFRYRVETFAAGRTPDTLASVKRTRIGWGATPGSSDKPPRSLRQFVVDFEDGPLRNLAAEQPVEAELSSSNGEVRHVTVEPLPDQGGWRVAFKLAPENEDEAVDLRMHLRLRDKRLSETWNYVWDPRAIQ